MTNNKPLYTSLSDLLDQVGRILFSKECCLHELWDYIIEAFLIPEIPGYFVTYKDISNLALCKRINSSWFHQLELIEKKYGGIPISKDALNSIKELEPELLPYHIPTEYYKYEDDPNEIYHNSDYGAVLFLNEFAIFESDGRFLFYRGRNKELKWQFYCSIASITDGFKSGVLETKYYDIEINDMVPISTGFWHSEQREILWKKGKVMIKEKYVECFVTSESSDEFLKALAIRNAKDQVTTTDQNNSVDSQNDVKVVKLLFAEDNEITGEKITKHNIENIKDSFSFRVFKLALICDARGYRKTTNETLADFIFNTQDWYFAGTHKTLTLAKKAASMVRAIDAAKGGVALDTRKYCPKTKEIV